MGAHKSVTRVGGDAKKKIKQSWHYMVLAYNTDRDALASTGAAGHDTYFKAPGKGKVLAKRH